MNGVQKAIKIIAICLGIVIIINILGGILFGLSLVVNIGVNTENVEVKTFEEKYDSVSKIDIDTVTSDIIIKSGNEFKVEANNMKNTFSSKAKNGTLKIDENQKWFNSNNLSGIITIYIPDDTVLKELKIDAGAGKIEIQDVIANKFDIDQGAGTLKISNSKFNQTDIDGGAGEINIRASVLNDLDLEAGVGRIDVEAEITGNSKIECGIGEMNLILLGKEDDYTITANKGFGNIKINDKDQRRNIVYGSGINKIRLEGGIGNITVDFE